MTHKAKPSGKKAHDHYTLKGDVPWPTLADGTEYTDALKRVTHQESGEAGTLGWLEWTHPDGTYMPQRWRTVTRNKRPVEVGLPGKWVAIVSWDNREVWEFPLNARVDLLALAPEA